MYDPRTYYSIDGRKRITAVKHQSVHQRPRIIPGRRMHHHSSRFVDHQQIIVLINDLKGNILRFHLQLLWSRYLDQDTVAFNALFFFAAKLPVSKNFSFFKEFLQKTSRKTVSLLC